MSNCVYIRGKYSQRNRSVGFSLIEVLVALVVCSIGLLGLAKMESLALASADVAGTRSIAAMEASSMAAAMHADRGYWATTSATLSAVVTGSTATADLNVTDANLNAVQDCTTAVCTTTQIAAYDVQGWGDALYALLPGYTGTIACPAAIPVVCTITIAWQENAVAANSSQTNMAGLAPPTYTMGVVP